jgi:hypothetical protein
MTVELYSAILSPSGPNYSSWHEVLGSDRVPLKSSASVKADFGPEKNVEAYFLDLGALTLPQRARLLAMLARKFKAPIYEVEAEITNAGFPIRAVDVIVRFDVRAFV